MNAKTSLIEQKRIQWAKEREEISRLNGNWGILKQSDSIRKTIRTYAANAKFSLSDARNVQPPLESSFRAVGDYEGAVGLNNSTTEYIGGITTSLNSLNYIGGSSIDLHDQTEALQMRRRSPSLPPIKSKEQQRYPWQEQQEDITELKRSHKLKNLYHRHRSNNFYENGKASPRQFESPGEEREGETSGYASDSIDVPLSDIRNRPVEQISPSSSIRRISDGKLGDLNRPRWSSIWGQETIKENPLPPSWLARLGDRSQVLVINHDSASSPDSSTTSSTSSDTNKTYLRGQNLPIDAEILQERETKRLKALKLQNTIKQQLEERERQKKEEKEKRIREEQLEDERIKRERHKEKERFEEEQKKLKEKEDLKMKKAEHMREILETAEHFAKEDKKNRLKKNKNKKDTFHHFPKHSEHESMNICQSIKENSSNITLQQNSYSYNEDPSPKEAKEICNQIESNNNRKERNSYHSLDQPTNEANSVQVPVSKDVAIVLSGRLEDSEIFNKTNLQLVNLVVTPSPRKIDSNTNNLPLGLNALIRNLDSPNITRNSSRMSPSIAENRLLTPSKYRRPISRDFGTQTDVSRNMHSCCQNIQNSSLQDESAKECKDTTNINRRYVEKSTATNTLDELSSRTFPRTKNHLQSRLDSRPRWNANRSATRYRTQSEKDPHYQRRLRLKKHRLESSNNRSRSPSPNRRKTIIVKFKTRNSNRRKLKIGGYDADVSVDSLNSILSLKINQTGKINVKSDHKNISDIQNFDNKCVMRKSENRKYNTWCGHQILKKLALLRDGLLMKQIEWNSGRSLVSPVASEIC